MYWFCEKVLRLQVFEYFIWFFTRDIYRQINICQICELEYAENGLSEMTFVPLFETKIHVMECFGSISYAT